MHGSLQPEARESLPSGALAHAEQHIRLRLLGGDPQKLSDRLQKVLEDNYRIEREMDEDEFLNETIMAVRK